MNEFCIEWLRGGEYAGVTTPSSTCLLYTSDLSFEQANKILEILRNEKCDAEE